METGPLTFGANRESWLGIFAPEVLALIHEPSFEKRLRALNELALRQNVQNALGQGVRFIAATTSQTGQGYERHIYRSGEITTRDNLHDFYNALAWLSFPRSKATLNALHIREIDRAPQGAGRGAVRDAATIFDECGMVFLTDRQGDANALRQMRWSTLFGVGRGIFARHCRPLVFGHALLEKLDAPYKSLTAHAWIVLSPPRILELAPRAQRRWVDAHTAEIMDSGIVRAALLAPIPVLGIPGWCEANGAPGFYDDPQVFRCSRARGASPATAAGLLT